MPAPTTHTVTGPACPPRLALARRPATSPEHVISSRRRPPARPTGAPAPSAVDGGPVPVVGQREPCPCGSGKRYKACHGRAAEPQFVGRPFAGLPDETEWVALREVVPAATAPLRVRGHEDRAVQVATILPLQWPAMVRADGTVHLGLQVQARSGDVSRDLAHALELALVAEPGAPVVPTGLPGPGPRLQDLLEPAPLEVAVHEGFGFWVEGTPDPDGDVAASLESANAAAVPTVRLSSVRSAYWCRMRTRSHLRWVLPEVEDPLLDALARLAVVDGLALGPETRFVGSFRAHGLLVPVWDLPHETEAASLEEPALALRARLDEALADDAPLTAEQRRARAGLVNRQLTLR